MTIDSLTPPHSFHVYGVGIMSSRRYVAAPTAKAATLFYGLRVVDGNMELGAVAYERDGEEKFDEQHMPWAEWCFGGGDKSKLEAEVKAVKSDVGRCSWWPSPKSIRAARIAGGEMPREEWYEKAMAIERECEW